MRSNVSRSKSVPVHLGELMNWLGLALVSAACLGVYDVCKKLALRGTDVLTVLLASNLVGAAALAPLLGLSALAPEVATNLRVFVAILTPRELALVGAKSALVTASWICSFYGLQHLPLSIAAPLRATAPLFTLVGAYLLFDERLGRWDALGVAVLLVAYWSFSWVGRREGIHFERNRWVWLVGLGTLLGAASGLYDKYLLQRLALPPLATQVWFTLGNVALLLLLALARLRSQRTRPSVRLGPAVLGIGGFLLLADLAYFHALAQTDALISVISMVRRSNIVVSFCASIFLLREAQPGRKAGAVALVVFGLALLLL